MNDTFNRYLPAFTAGSWKRPFIWVTPPLTNELSFAESSWTVACPIASFKSESHTKPDTVTFPPWAYRSKLIQDRHKNNKLFFIYYVYHCYVFSV